MTATLGVMLYEDLVNTVIKLGHLNPSQSGEAGVYVQDAYEMVWTAADWQFRHETVQVSVSANSQTVGNLPDDLGIVSGLWRGNLGSGQRLTYVWEDVFVGRWTVEGIGIIQPGPPCEYTIIGDQILVGPASDEDATDYTILHEKAFTPLEPATAPALPKGTHMVIAYAAAATALVSENDFFFQFCDGRYQARLEAMKREYTITTRDEPQHWPSAAESWPSNSWG